MMSYSAIGKEQESVCENLEAFNGVKAPISKMQIPKITEDNVSVISFYVTDADMLNFLTSGSNSKPSPYCDTPGRTVMDTENGLATEARNSEIVMPKGEYYQDGLKLPNVMCTSSDKVSMMTSTTENSKSTCREAAFYSCNGGSLGGAQTAAAGVYVEYDPAIGKESTW